MPNSRTVLIFVLTLLISMGPTVPRTKADANHSRGEGAINRVDPCTILPTPPGNANGIDKQCPAAGSSSGVSRGDFNGDGFADLAISEPGARFPIKTARAM